MHNTMFCNALPNKTDAWSDYMIKEQPFTLPVILKEIPFTSQLQVSIYSAWSNHSWSKFYYNHTKINACLFNPRFDVHTILFPHWGASGHTQARRQSVHRLCAGPQCHYWRAGLVPTACPPWPLGLCKCIVDSYITVSQFYKNSLYYEGSGCDLCHVSDTFVSLDKILATKHLVNGWHLGGIKDNNNDQLQYNL